MIRTINPCAAARTAEIMSRYRPIAPKPEAAAAADNDRDSALPDGIRKSPYLRNVWAHLQARPTRTRKRGRSAAFAPPTPPVKRNRACLQGLSSPYHQITAGQSMHGLPCAAASKNGVHPEIQIFPNLVCGSAAAAVTTLSDSVAARPLLQISPKLIDLNTTAAPSSPEELDFMPQLQEPAKPAVISPKPIRPVGSTITVANVSSGPGKSKQIAADDAEAALEEEAVPAIISDSHNKVRLTNSAYKEMVGQPECGWLDCTGGAASRRIGGEVVLQFRDWEPQLGMHGFHCRVKIEWESQGMKKSVSANCSGVKLGCWRKDYQFLWRIHTTNTSVGSSETED